MAHAVATNSPSIVTLKFLPQEIPESWLVENRPFENNPMEGSTFLLNLRSKFLALGDDSLRDPRYAVVFSGLEAHKRRMEAEEQAKKDLSARRKFMHLIAMRFKDKWTTLCTIIGKGDAGSACHILRPLMEVMLDDEHARVVKEQMGEGYNRPEFSRALAQQLVRQCPNAECFFEIVKFCK